MSEDPRIEHFLQVGDLAGLRRYMDERNSFDASYVNAPVPREVEELLEADDSTALIVYLSEHNPEYLPSAWSDILEQAAQPPLTDSARVLLGWAANKHGDRFAAKMLTFLDKNE